MIFQDTGPEVWLYLWDEVTDEASIVKPYGEPTWATMKATIDEIRTWIDAGDVEIVPNKSPRPPVSICGQCDSPVFSLDYLCEGCR